jgi:hypothetical protein
MAAVTSVTFYAACSRKSKSSIKIQPQDSKKHNPRYAAEVTELLLHFCVACNLNKALQAYRVRKEIAPPRFNIDYCIEKIDLYITSIFRVEHEAIKARRKRASILKTRPSKEPTI